MPRISCSSGNSAHLEDAKIKLEIVSFSSSGHSLHKQKQGTCSSSPSCQAHRACFDPSPQTLPAKSGKRKNGETKILMWRQFPIRE
ncbi:unnamed protein product [Linum tenue]|uniref:Uncharacterized protein n=1 Tax=Linum tenue TaxID=586396 RepID=A0AAV0MYH3_9ROSI|nr:unnamed protein product [Linum tenue]